MMESASSESPDDGRFSSQYLNHLEEKPDTVVLETTDVIKIDCSVADKISGTLSIMEIT